MFQHQDILYRNGALSLVWLVGNGGLKNTKRRSKLMISVLRASVADLCDRISEVLNISRSIGSNVQGYTQEKVLDIKTISILILGVNTMHKFQIVAFKKEVEALYDLCRWKMTQVINNQAIDLPISMGNRLEISLNMSQQEGFGEMYINEPGFFDDEEQPQNRLPMEENASPTMAPPEVSNSTMDVVEIIRRQKVEQRRAASKKRKSDRKNYNNDDQYSDGGILRLLQESLNRADSRDITMVENELPRAQEDLVMNDDPNYRFGDFDDQEQGNTIRPENQSPTLDGHHDGGPQITDVEMTDLTVGTSRDEVTPGPLLPVDSFRLERMIQQDTPGTPPDDNIGTPRRRKRRRTYWIQADDEIEFSSEDMRENVKDNNLSDQETNQLLQSGRAVVLPPNIRFPFALQTNARAIDAIKMHRGRGIGNTLTEMLVDIQDGQLNLSTEERRRDVSAALADEDVSHTLRRDDTDLTNLPSHRSPRTEPGISASAVEDETSIQLPLQDELPPMESFDNMQENVTVGEEQRTPQKLGNYDEGHRSALVETRVHGDGKFFHELFPPATTKKLQAALEFRRLLKLQKQGKVVLQQESPYGPIKINIK